MCEATWYVVVCKHCGRAPPRRVPEYVGQRDSSQTVKKVDEHCPEYNRNTKTCPLGSTAITHRVKLTFEDICENEDRDDWVARNTDRAGIVMATFAALLEQYPSCPCDCPQHRLADQKKS